MRSKLQGGKNRRRGKNENESEKRELIFKEDGQGNVCMDISARAFIARNLPKINAQIIALLPESVYLLRIFV